MKITMDELQEIEGYINKEIKPYLPMIIGKIRIKDIRPKSFKKEDAIKTRILKYIKLSKYQYIGKNQSFLYKPIYRLEK